MKPIWASTPSSEHCSAAFGTRLSQSIDLYAFLQKKHKTAFHYEIANSWKRQIFPGIRQDIGTPTAKL